MAKLKSNPDGTLDTPATPGKTPVMRVTGAEEEIVEGVGLTRLREVFYLPTSEALALIEQGPRFAHAHPTMGVT